MNPQREKVQNYIFDILKTICPQDKLNHAKYQELFDKMDDRMFDQWMQDIRDRKTKLYYIQKNDLHNNAVLTEDNLCKAAKKIGVKLEQRLKIWDRSLKRYYKTPYTYIVLRVPVRRLKQNLLSKMSVPDGDNKINPVTGQVIKPDKAASISMTEAQTIASKGLSKTLTEFLTVRGGDVNSYGNYKSMLEDLGDVRLKDLKLENSTVRSVSITKVYLEAMQLENNL